MRKITAEEYKKFLAENGYEWAGAISRSSDRFLDAYFEPFERYETDLDKKYIYIKTPCEVMDFRVNATDNECVKYIEHDSTTFRVYNAVRIKSKTFTFDTKVKYELEKDLSKEWVKYQARIFPESIQAMIENCRLRIDDEDVLANDEIGLIRRDIARLELEARCRRMQADERIKYLNGAIETLTAYQEEKGLLREAIRLREKDNFKDNIDNDGCLEYSTDTFVK